MNAALQRETLAEVAAIRLDFHNTHLLVIDGHGTIMGASADLAVDRLDPADLLPLTPEITRNNLWGEPLRISQRYFPFWDWRIVSYIAEDHYLAPLRLVRRAVMVGVLGGPLLVTLTLVVVLRRFVDLPLRRLIEATRGVAGGRYERLTPPRCDEIGTMMAAFNAMVDSLEHRDTEVANLVAALRSSEERFRVLFASSPAGIGLAAPNGHFAECNDAMLELLGCRRETLRHLTLAGLFHDARKGRRLLERLRAEPVVRNTETELQRVEGTSFAARITVSRVNLKGERLTLVMAEDITRERQLETQLQRAQKMEAIGTLAGGVAHDLNNILSAVVNYPELLLLDLPADSPLVKPLGAIQQAGQKAAAIVQDLLTLARRGVSVTEVINLNQVVTDYLHTPEFERLRGFHPRVTVDTRLSPDLLNIAGSPVHIAKTLMNLLSNAAEAMPEGGVITIGTENRYVDRPVRGYDRVKEGGFAVLTVSDSGRGIPPEDLEHIFEPFFTKKTMGRSGTGLGMAVVWGTVKDHRGYIDVHSREGRGTTFTLYFPVTRESADGKPAPFSIDRYTGRGEVILVVDDVAEQRRLASSLLTRLNYRVVTAPGGTEAVACLRRHPVDLVLLDMIMDPGIDGLETYLRLLEVQPGVKTVIASGFSETRRVREAQRRGAGAYLKKPYTLAKLAQTIQAELQAGDRIT